MPASSLQPVLAPHGADTEIVPRCGYHGLPVHTEAGGPWLCDECLATGRPSRVRLWLSDVLGDVLAWGCVAIALPPLLLLALVRAARDRFAARVTTVARGI